MKKALIAYFSQGNTTKAVAKNISTGIESNPNKNELEIATNYMEKFKLVADICKTADVDQMYNQGIMGIRLR